MRGAFRYGWRFALHSRPLVLGCFAFNATLGLVCLAFLWMWFGAALDDALATRSLLVDADPQVWLDLLANQSARVMAGVRELVVLAGMGLVLSIWANGLIASAVAQHDGLVRPHARAALRALPRLIGLAAGVWLAQAVTVAAALVIARWTKHHLGDGAGEFAVLGIWITAGGATLVVVSILMLVHDHARLSVLHSERGAAASFRWALHFLRRQGARAATLLALFLAFGLLLSFCQVQASVYLPTTSSAGSALSLLLAEGVLLMRVGMRTALYAAEWRLQAQFDRQAS